MVTDLQALWRAHPPGVEVGEAALDADLLSCLDEGDGVADHYGGRTGFVFLEQRGDRSLVVERRGSGVWGWNAINLTGGYGTGILGAQLAGLGPALQHALSRCSTTNDEFQSVERRRLADTVKTLVARHTGSDPSDWELTFTSTGTEANDLALQLAYVDDFDLASGMHAAPDKDVVLCCHGAWHGWGLHTAQALDRRHFTDGLPRLSERRFVFMRYGDERELERAFAEHGGRIRAVLVEGVLGDGGVVVAPDAWWTRLRQLCDAHGATLIDDEILTWLRCGGPLALPRGISPDCLTIGKSLGLSLFPLSAVAWRRDRLKIRPGLGVRTFNARPFQAAVVSEALQRIEGDGMFTRAAEVGDRFRARLTSLAGDFPGIVRDVRGKGLFIGMELAGGFARKGHFMRDALLRGGVMSEVESGTINRRLAKEDRINETIRLTPPLTIPEQELDEALVRIHRVFMALSSSDATTGAGHALPV